MAAVSASHASYMSRRRRRVPEWEGRGTIAYVTTDARENFEALPEDVHQRLQNAASELNGQNSVVPRILQGLNPGTASIDTSGLSAVERYELARYQIDYPPEENRHPETASRQDHYSPNSMGPSGHTRKSAQNDYVRHLISRTDRWKASTSRLQKAESLRKRVAGIGLAAVTGFLEENNMPAELRPSDLQCVGSFQSGFALSDSHLDVLLEFNRTTTSMPRNVLYQLQMHLVRAFLDAGLCAALASNPIDSKDTIVKLCQKPNPDFLETLRDKYINNPTEDDGSDVYFSESLGRQCHIHFAPHSLMFYNSDLMRCYNLCDERVAKMAHVIKKWVKERSLNNPGRGFPSTYAYMLMLVHYLLHVADPPVVPNLLFTTLGSGTREPRWVGGREVNYWSNRSDIIANSQAGTLSHNNQSAASLLREFFTYYSSSWEKTIRVGERTISPFFWKHDVVSARQDGLKKFDKGWAAVDRGANGSLRFNFLAIEDPFEPDRGGVAESVHPTKVQAIRDEFARAHMILTRVKLAPGPEWEWRTDEGRIGDDLLDIRNPSSAELELAERQARDRSSGAPTNRNGMPRLRRRRPVSRNNF